MARRNVFATACAVALASTCLMAAQRDLGREVLAANDGWASLGDGVTGGSVADADHAFVVRSRAEFLAALNAPPRARRESCTSTGRSRPTSTTITSR